MHRYHYATVKLSSLVELSKIPVPTDSYVSADEESLAIKTLLNRGYRMVAVVPENDAAIFEKVLEGFSPEVNQLLNANEREDPTVAGSRIPASKSS